MNRLKQLWKQWVGKGSSGKDWDWTVRIFQRIILVNLIAFCVVLILFMLIMASRHEGPIPEMWKQMTVNPE